jgi:hypothetical protein
VTRSASPSHSGSPIHSASPSHSASPTHSESASHSASPAHSAAPARSGSPAQPTQPETSALTQPTDIDAQSALSAEELQRAQFAEALWGTRPPQLPRPAEPEQTPPPAPAEQNPQSPTLAETKAALSTLSEEETPTPASALTEDPPTTPLNKPAGTAGRSILNSLAITTGSGGRRRAPGDDTPRKTRAERRAEEAAETEAPIAAGWPSEPDVSQALYLPPRRAKEDPSAPSHSAEPTPTTLRSEYAETSRPAEQALPEDTSPTPAAAHAADASPTAGATHTADTHTPAASHASPVPSAAQRSDSVTDSHSPDGHPAESTDADLTPPWATRRMPLPPLTPARVDRASSYEETRAELAQMMSTLNAKALRARSTAEDKGKEQKKPVGEALVRFDIAALHGITAPKQTIPTPPEPDDVPEPPGSPDIPEPPNSPDLPKPPSHPDLPTPPRRPEREPEAVPAQPSPDTPNEPSNWPDDLGDPTRWPDKPGEPAKRADTQRESPGQFDAPNEPTGQPDAPNNLTSWPDTQRESARRFDPRSEPTGQPDAPNSLTSWSDTSRESAGRFDPPSEPTGQLDAPNSLTSWSDTSRESAGRFDAPGEPTGQPDAPNKSANWSDTQRESAARFDPPGEPTGQPGPSGESTGQSGALNKSAGWAEAPRESARQSDPSGEPAGQSGTPNSPTGRSGLMAALDALTGPVLSEPAVDFRTEFGDGGGLPSRKPSKSWTELESSAVVESPADELFGKPAEKPRAGFKSALGAAFADFELPPPVEAPSNAPEARVEHTREASTPDRRADESSDTFGERSASAPSQAEESATDGTRPSNATRPPSGALVEPTYAEPIGPQRRPAGLPRRERSATTIASLLTEALAAYQSTTDGQDESPRAPESTLGDADDEAAASGRHRSPE